MGKIARVCLSRRLHETIEIAGGAAAGGVTVKIDEVKYGKVRMSIMADRDVTIHRGEVQLAIDRRKMAELAASAGQASCLSATSPLPGAA